MYDKNKEGLETEKEKENGYEQFAYAANRAIRECNKI